jgi:hypothetical protein
VRVIFLTSAKILLMPCHPEGARELLKKGKVAVFRMFPFTIILKNREEGEIQHIEFKADPSSKKTGLSLVLHGKIRKKVVFAANLEHRGSSTKKRLEQRHGVRKDRKNRKIRYRSLCSNNRSRPKGWLPLSLIFCLANIYNIPFIQSKKIFQILKNYNKILHLKAYNVWHTRIYFIFR